MQACVTSSHLAVSRVSVSSSSAAVALASTPHRSRFDRSERGNTRLSLVRGWKVSERAERRRRRRRRQWGAVARTPELSFLEQTNRCSLPVLPVQRVQCLARAGRSPRGRGSWPWPSDGTHHRQPPSAAAAAVATTHPPTPSTSRPRPVPRCLPSVCHRREQSLRSLFDRARRGGASRTPFWNYYGATHTDISTSTRRYLPLGSAACLSLALLRGGLHCVCLVTD